MLTVRLPSPEPRFEKSPQELNPRLSVFAARGLYIAAVAILLNVVLCLPARHHLPLIVGPVILVVVLMVLARVRPEVRIVSLGVVLGCAAIGIAGELALNALYGTAISQVPQAKSGVDNRTLMEVVSDMWRAGEHVYPVGSWTKIVDGNELNLLSGIPNHRVVWGNESGQYWVQDADEYGFSNPPRLWKPGAVDVVLVGDSFVLGAYVPFERNLVGVVRRSFPATVGLGMNGAGPLNELAMIREYAALLKPKVVVWCYHDNDFYDLNQERKRAVLRRYLSPGYSQSLAAQSGAIKATLERSFPDFLAAHASPWPRWARTAGIKESGAPFWVRDLILGTGYSTLARTIRFDQIYKRIDALLLRATSDPPDFDLYQTILGQAKSEVEGWGGSFCFAYIPGWAPLRFDKHDSNTLRERLVARVERLGIPVIDPSSRMKAVGNVNRLFFYPHSHYNEVGYQLVGTVISDSLRQHAPAIHPATEQK